MTDTPIDFPAAGTEAQTLIGGLDRIRRTFEWKCADLDAAAMATTIGVSAITLGGLVRHLSHVETIWFVWKLHDRDPGPGHDDEDFARDWRWTAQDDVDELWRGWHAATRRSRDLLAEAVAAEGMDYAQGHQFEGWGAPSARRVVVDMIEEYARHTGHADLIRETIDGRVGEDAPPAGAS